MEWAIEVMRELGIPVACTMRMVPTGDIHNVPPGECAVRMANAGEYPCSRNWISDIVGLNCQYDTDTCILQVQILLG